jgi:hypothetical protein
VRKRRHKKPKRRASNSQNVAAIPVTTPTIELPAQPTPPTPQRRKYPLRKLFQIGTIAALATIVVAGPQIFEEYNKTYPAAEAKGDFDVLHPFNNSLAIRNQSATFDMHFVQVTCKFAGIWGNTPFDAGDMHVYRTELITAHDPFVFTSEVTSSISATSLDNMKSVPLRQGIIVVQIQYEIWLFPFWKLTTIKSHRTQTIYLNYVPSPSPHWIMGNKLM